MSKFSKDLNTKVWTTLLFEKEETMLLGLNLAPFEDDSTLATFISMTGKNINFHSYILDKNGSIVNQVVFEDINSASHLVAVLKDKIFLVTNEYRFENDKAPEFIKLTCLKYNK